MRNVMKLQAIVLLAAAVASTALAQTPLPSGATAVRPFVEISIAGADVVLRPTLLHYRVRADAGSYVTIFRISPSGRVSPLNPYERAIEGSELSREAETGTEPGQSYLVAVATRSKQHSEALAARATVDGRLAGGYVGAEASLDNLLQTLSRTGDDFSVSYVSFRLLSPRTQHPFAYATNCSSAALFAADGYYYTSGAYDGGPFYGDAYDGGPLYGNSAIGGNAFYATPFYDSFSDPGPLVAYGNEGYFDQACPYRMMRRVVAVAKGPTSTPSAGPRDTTHLGADSVPKLFPPSRVHPLPIPRDSASVRISSEGVVGVMPAKSWRVRPEPNVPVDGGRNPAQRFQHPETPVAIPIPVSPEAREPSGGMTLPLRIDPIPVQRERSDPVSSPPPVIERPTPVVQPVETQPPPPPPPPPSTPPRLLEHPVVQPPPPPRG